MAIFGNGTGMGFSVCADNQSVTSWESTNCNFFSVTILPKTAALTGGQISGGTLSINFNGGVSAIALSALNGLYIRPTYASVRFNQDNGCLETFNPTTETWGTGKETAGR